MDNLDELREDAEFVINKIYGSASDLLIMGGQMERIKFFESFRDLIGEKIAQQDEIAVEVLSWAYQKLADD